MKNDLMNRFVHKKAQEWSKMKDSVLRMEHITKKYKENAVLMDVNLHIMRGEIYGLVGNNGAGKTTLMRLIAGQSFADEGSIYLFDSNEEKKNAEYRKRMGALIEEPAFHLGMTAGQNLEYFRIQFGIPEKNRIHEVLSMVGLKDTGKKKVSQFSLGMKQRLGIALSLLHSPELLILDEPINGLDPAGILEMRQMLLMLNRKHNTTIMISSHILAELENIVTCYGFLSRGRMLEEITSQALAEKCASFLNIFVDQPEKLCRLLEKELGYKDFKVYPDQCIHLYEGLEDGNKICELAIRENISLNGLEKRRMSLENYYMKLVEEC